MFTKIKSFLSKNKKIVAYTWIANCVVLLIGFISTEVDDSVIQKIKDFSLWFALTRLLMEIFIVLFWVESVVAIRKVLNLSIITASVLLKLKRFVLWLLITDLAITIIINFI